MDNTDTKRGSIVKIYVENFVTYDKAVIRPGPKLNVVIGPNGTGKSTIICAIILGLGGKPKVLGRAAQTGDFVKTGRSKATIEIELYKPKGKNYVVTRTLTADGHTAWMLNSKPATLKEVEALTKSLKIQVSNLCQFLPQDKVQDFSKMNAQELLENTEKSVGDPILLEYHLKLKDLRKRHVVLQQEIVNHKNLLDNQTQKYDRLKEIVSGIKEKKAIKQKILYLRQKKAWLLYDASRQELVNAKQVRDAAVKEMNQLLETMKPVEKTLAKLNKQAAAAEHTMQTKIKQTLIEARNLNSIVDNITSHEENIKETMKSLAYKLKVEATRDQEIATAQQQKKKLENDLQRIIKEFGDAASLAEKQRKIFSTIDEQRSSGNQIAQELYKLKKEQDQIKMDMNAQEAALQKINNVEIQRLMKLKEKNMDAYKGVLWLRQNLDKFSTVIHEPMMLKINVKSAQYSKYIENSIPVSDLYAFVCEGISDMNLLISNLRIQQKLRINFIHSDPNKKVNMTPRIPIENIARFGFEYYLSSLISAPQTILNYLVSQYHLNNKPIGNDNVENNVDGVPNSITTFYSRNNRYGVSRSKYTGEKSTRVARVRGNGFLSIIKDTSNLEDIRAKIAALNDRKEIVAQYIADVEKKNIEAEEKMQALRARAGEFSNRIEQIKTVKTRISIIGQKINKLESERSSVEEIKATNNRKINDIIVQQMKLYEKYNKALEEYIESNHETACIKLEAKLMQSTFATKQAEYREMKARCSEAERIVRNFDSELQPLKHEAKRIYDEALALTDGIGPQDKGFEKLNQAFSKLPATIVDINQELQVAEAKKFCLGKVMDGDNILQEYESVKNDIKNLNAGIDSQTTEVQSLVQNMEEIRNKWLPPLEELVNSINQNFSSYFAIMNCAGEVSLTYGEDIMDFEQYGLKIRVKFRDSDALQELNRTHQSGGERTVTTAIYMIALQELSRVPFRCVDEINQGMDSINERRVFELIVDITGKTNGSQYFLLTPKLLPALLYSETITIHCVYNGPFAVSYEEFDINEYCGQLAHLNRG